LIEAGGRHACARLVLERYNILPFKAQPEARDRSSGSEDTTTAQRPADPPNRPVQDASDRHLVPRVDRSEQQGPAHLDFPQNHGLLPAQPNHHADHRDQNS